MRISIIIPAFNEEKLLPGTLAGIKAASPAFLHQGWELELIVCDNNSTDGTSALARASGARVVFEPVNQIGRARNCGAQAATGEWLLFIDADSRPSAALFGEVAAQIVSGECLAGGVTVTLDTASRGGALITEIWNFLSRAFHLLAGSFIFCEAEAFHQVGGFSTDLFAGEELELTRKLKRLARARQKQIVILHAHPLITSARKIHLYTFREHTRFLLRAALARRRVLTSRQECHTWYDGRR